ncbi:uncharacterized protein B0H18DRAFT_970496 [Fomitopsis serialis]|uniref:uncharacterized protein n=1 Tax=Fomitopsis serialis TaxID=139415 RepID=UPI002007BD0E|nr:uncharacterized protein B0H18DRAFT_970496 [Neoantrodia serialis]KAH9937419.1 hypothetical protein B0H18DRAFT_970496 [Neoantrodia serialis]
MSNAVPFSSNTRVMSFSDLSEDVLDQILRRLPDFKTLAATIRTSKQLYGILDAHPKSITRKIAETACGHPGVLPAALRLVRKVIKGNLEDDETEPEDEDENEIVVPQEPPEGEMLAVPLTREEAQLLEEHGEVIRSMQDIYSRRHKDRMSSASRLTPDEALPFKRGMYRFWLFCECYAPSEDDDRDDYRYDDRQAARQRAADEFLELLPADDLFEVGAAAAFCAEMHECNYTAANAAHNHPMIPNWHLDHSCLGPGSIMEDFEKLAITQPEDSGLFWTSFERAVTRLGLNQKTRDDRLADAITREVVGANDSCDRCHAVRGIDLWGATNWPLIRGFISLFEFTTLLPGHLPRNDIETTPLLQRLGSEHYFRGTCRAEADEIITKLMEEMIETDVDGGGTWTRDGWYCLDCVRELFKERLWRWWYAKKREGGAPEMENCWYGYNCRTMLHRRLHASKLNHLCVPTRGEL